MFERGMEEEATNPNQSCTEIDQDKSKWKSFIFDVFCSIYRQEEEEEIGKSIDGLSDILAPAILFFAYDGKQGGQII